MPSPKSRSANFSLAIPASSVQWENLEKEHQWLLKQIKKKRTELKNLTSNIINIGTEIFHKINPLYQQMADIDQEIHQLFTEIFTKKSLGKKSRKKIEKIYRNLQMVGVISYQEEDENDNFIELDDFFTDEVEEEDQEDFSDNFQDNREIPSREIPGKSEESKKIRKTFLRLATIFHPDKIEDNSKHEQYTEIMKIVNKAYQEGDLATLLEIEKQYLAEEKININNQDELQRRCEVLAKHNDLLKAQYEQLKEELRFTKKTSEGTMVIEYRKAMKKGVNPINEMVEEITEQIKGIKSIRNLVKQLWNQQISIKEFEKNLLEIHDPTEEYLDEILGRFYEEEIIIFRN